MDNVTNEEINDVTSREEAVSLLHDEMAARLARIEHDFTDGLAKLSKYTDGVSIYGSARLPETSLYYKKAWELGTALAKSGHTVITGGGGGIMEAGNRGAFEAGGESIGLNIELPKEQTLNSYVTDSQSFRYFFSRKVMLDFGSQVLVFFPGGFGTLDELTEALTLLQTKKIPSLPIILFGSEFWEPFDEFVKNYLLREFHTIEEQDRELYVITDDINYVVKVANQQEHDRIEKVLKTTLK